MPKIQFRTIESGLARAVGEKIFVLIQAYINGLRRRSEVIPRVLERRVETIGVYWALFFMLTCIPKLLLPVTPPRNFADVLAVALPYLAIALVPLGAYRLTISCFPNGLRVAQPELHWPSFGNWRQLSVLDAKANPLFGPAGFMASLLVGLLLNVPVRSFEFIVAMPAVSGSAPFWAQELFLMMAADVVIMSFFYVVCFAMALKAVPYFPRMLVFAWVLDVAMQQVISRSIGANSDLPAGVAQSLNTLLEGNMTKVAISAAIWLPYLILSERVNVTYRKRVSVKP